jgi:multisubunit Na+/H+ antiporter MnhC subunit
LLLLLRQLRIFAAAAVRPHATQPHFSGEGKYQEKKSPVASVLALGHVCIGVGVVEVAVWCKHFMSEVIAEKITVFHGRKA